MLILQTCSLPLLLLLEKTVMCVSALVGWELFDPWACVWATMILESHPILLDHFSLKVDNGMRQTTMNISKLYSKAN